MEIQTTLLSSGVAGKTQHPALDADKTARTEALAQTSQQLMHKQKYELTIAEEAIVKAIEKANKALQGVYTRFEYRIHKPSGEIMVKVIDQESNEVIREIPPEKLLDLVTKLQEICGVIIDEKR